jgi:hypothetical protein
MHIKVAKCGVLWLSPDARDHKFSLFTYKGILIEHAPLIVKETLQPVLSILRIEQRRSLA